MKVPKAYFIDIDGTLTSGHLDANINYLDEKSIKAAARDGAYIILSTGRSIEATLPVWEQIQIDKEVTNYIACNNGAVIMNAATKEILKETFLDKKTFIAIFQMLYSRGYAVKHAGANKYYSKKGYSTGTFIKSFANVQFDMDGLEWNEISGRKIGCITTLSKRTVRKIKKEIEEKFSDIEVAISGPGLYLEITKKGANKGEVIKYLSNKLSLEVEDTVHIGDSMNDAKGFEVAGTSVAMDNGMKELKKKATFITKSVKKNGVANAIDSLRQKRNK